MSRMMSNNESKGQESDMIEGEYHEVRSGTSVWACCQTQAFTSSNPSSTAESEEYGQLWIGPVARAQRTTATAWLAYKMHTSVKSLEKELERSQLDEDAKQKRWDELHLRNAQMSLEHIKKYRGFFTKLGQGMSTMKGILRDPWTDTLAPLQDSLPASPFSRVQQIIKEDLGRPIEDIFLEFEKKPVASASIAQAHVARLLTGEKVCVKVQHMGVAEMTGPDLAIVEHLFSWMASLHDEAPDLSGLIQEWKRAASEEVDFRLEAKNGMDARDAFHSHQLNVGAPKPLPAFTSGRVLTMKFIEGFKITEKDNFPPNFDRESAAALLVEAFVMLVFEEGLIHGDPHPGNVFLEPTGLNQEMRPVLLDWGIVRRLTEAERVALAQWVVASLSMDRFLYLSAICQLGFEVASDLDCEVLDKFLLGGMVALRTSVPSSATGNFFKIRHEQEKLEREKRKSEAKKEGKKMKRMVERIPGVINFFFRGIRLVHDICSMLDVSVPVGKIMLKYALPLLDSARPVACIPCRATCSALEAIVRAKLDELSAAGSILGAQVAVLPLDGGTNHCTVAAGRVSWTGPALSDKTLLPLLDVGIGVLAHCMLMVLSRPTVTGKKINLGTPLDLLWPEFCRANKVGISIQQLLQRQAGIQTPFSSDFTYQMFCNEGKMEDLIAASPYSSQGPYDASVVQGVAIASLLRRATGQQTVAQALRSILEPLGLHEDIVYHSVSRDMGMVAHKLLEEVTMADLLSMIEEREQRTDKDTNDKEWLTCQEFAMKQPWCFDPLIVNHEDFRTGKECSAGRGLRATAQSLCQLYTCSIHTLKLLEQTRAETHRLSITSLQEWEDLGKCLDVATGWQVLKFRRLDGTGEVWGYGHIDGSTGSVALQIPNVASIAVLLTCVDKETVHAGQELITVIANQWGLEPVWYEDKPELSSTNQTSTSEAAPSEVMEKLRQLEDQVAYLTSLLEAQQSGSAGPANHAGEMAGIAGKWISAEMEGFEEMFDMFNAPSTLRTLIKKMKKAIKIEARGETISIHSQTSLGTKQVEDSTCTFKIGEPFVGDQSLGGSFKAVAKRENDNSGQDVKQSIVVEKQFSIKGREVTVREEYIGTEEGRLALRTTFVGQGEVRTTISSSDEWQDIRKSVDPKTLRLKRDLVLSGTQVWRGGYLVAPQSLLTTKNSSADVPGTVVLQYKDVQSTIMFDLEGGRRPANRSKPLNQVRGQAITSSSSDTHMNESGSNETGIQRMSSSGTNTCGDGVLACITMSVLSMRQVAKRVCESKAKKVKSPEVKRQMIPTQIQPGDAGAGG